jgi:hypothetical protein
MRRARFLTGDHFVRDVRCKCCGNRLGWFYEMATKPEQRYKESMTVLECAKIAEKEQPPDLAQDALTRP